MKQKFRTNSIYLIYSICAIPIWYCRVHGFNRITIGQAVLQLIIGLAVLGLSTYLINYLVKEVPSDQDSTMSDL